jgi:hypothetical protein
VQFTDPPELSHDPSTDDRDNVTVGPKDPGLQSHVYDVDAGRGKGLNALSKDGRGG